MSTPLYGLFLTVKGEVKKVKVTDGQQEPSLTALFKKKTVPKKIGTYEAGSTILTLFGYTEGRAGTENKHELPPPHDELLCFGDILLIASKSPNDWKNPISFTAEQYEKFYNKAFGGFEDLESEDESEEEEEVELEEEEEPVAKEDEEEEDDIEEEEEEDEEEEDEELGGDEDGDGDAGDEEVVVVKKKSTPKKKSGKVNLTVQSNTGRAKQQDLLLKKQVEELPPADDLGIRKIAALVPGREKSIRSVVLSALTTQLGKQLKQSILPELELVILYQALVDADKKSIYRSFENPLFEVLYLSASRSLLANLIPSSYVGNESLFQKLKKGQISTDNLKSMTVMDYAPHLYKDLRDKQILREQNQLEGNKALATDRFTCSRCHQKQCTYYELQTRSADEPMTIFITCENCGKRWRQ